MTLVSYDTIIRNGRWFDGTGAPSAIRNIGIRDGHIAAITPTTSTPPTARRSSTRSGKWVLPGMIDIHTHYDVEVLDGPSLAESLRHGVTTVMLGSCSLSTIHVDGVDAGDLFGRVEAIPARARHRRRRSAQDLVELRGVRRRTRGAAARPQSRGLHRPLRYAHRDDGT